MLLFLLRWFAKGTCAYYRSSRSMRLDSSNAGPVFPAHSWVKQVRRFHTLNSQFRFWPPSPSLSSSLYALWRTCSSPVYRRSSNLDAFSSACTCRWPSAAPCTFLASPWPVLSTPRSRVLRSPLIGSFLASSSSSSYASPSSLFRSVGRSEGS